MDETPEESAEKSHIDALRRFGFAFVAGAQMNASLGHVLGARGWTRFADSWNNLPTDNYLAAHGTYRRRRHAVYGLSCDGEAHREPHQPHFQSKTYNTLQGGIERWFEPIEADIGSLDVLQKILSYCAGVFGSLAPDVPRWRVEVHQFRIEARAGQEGLPTPEGVHRDGVDYVLVLLIARKNISRGTTTIRTADGSQLGSFTLTDPLDTALVDDARVFHGVTPVRPLHGAQPAFRDVLVVTLSRRPVGSNDR